MKCGAVFAEFHQNKSNTKKIPVHPVQEEQETPERTIKLPFDLNKELPHLPHIVRTICGFICIILLFPMFMNGTAFSSLFSYFVLLFFGFAGLFLILSFRLTVSVKWFIAESSMIIAMLLLTLIFAPEYLSPRSRSGTDESPADKNVSEGLSLFVTHASQWVDNCSKFIHLKEIKNSEEWLKHVASLDFDRVRFIYSKLNPSETNILYDTFREMDEIQKMINLIVSTRPPGTRFGPSEWIPSYLYRDTNSLLVKVKSKLSASSQNLK
jgi:hypothetical protein